MLQGVGTLVVENWKWADEAWQMAEGQMVVPDFHAFCEEHGMKPGAKRWMVFCVVCIFGGFWTPMKFEVPSGIYLRGTHLSCIPSDIADATRSYFAQFSHGNVRPKELGDPGIASMGYSV
jgi:hypothetical protein